MLGWLAIWGVSQAVGIVVYPILQDLAKEGAKDFAKDFFKDSLKHVVIREKDPRNIAAGKAIKDFLQLVQQELKDADVSDAQLPQYTKPLKEFINDKSVKEILGSAFKDDSQALDTKTLAKIWYQLNLSPGLPEEFDWELIGKLYRKKVKAIIRELPELRVILDSQNLEAIQQNTKELAGISPEFDLRRYQEGLQERYSNLNLDSLDTSVYDYREKLKVWQVFIAQNVRECQEFLPQVYEIPKEHQKRLRESNELEADVDPQESERYKQVYYQQPVRSVLDVVNDLWKDPPQPPLARGENLDSSQSLLKTKSEENLEPPLKRGAGGIDSCRYVVILGDPGSGKSTLLQYIALNWARTPLNNVISQPIPLLIELRTYSRDRNSGQCKDFLEFFHKGSVICRLNQHQLHEQLKAGKVLVMFDGLDEVFDPVQREEVITHIHRFTNDYPSVRVIVTSRIIGYKPQRLRDAEFRHFMLQDLESDQIQDFIYRWHELTFTDEADKLRKRERLQQAIKTSSAIGELAGNPLLLTMMAILNRNQELPRDRPELYNQASRVLLHQWDVEQKLLENQGVDSVAIDYKDKQAMLRQVAYHMQAADKGLAGNLIRGDDLEKILTGYLKSIEVSQARTVARLLIEQLRSRNFILCFLGADSYAFVHRTFLEYFCACEFVERFGKRGLEGGLTLEELKTEVFGKHWQDESWHEVLRLIVGKIDTSFAGQIIDYLMAQDGEAERFSNLFLAAECLSEVRNRSVLGTAANQLLNHLKGLTKYDLNYYYESGDEEASLVFDIRTQAVASVAATWQDDPETLLWLKTLALSDGDSDVQIAAVEELGRSWQDDQQTLGWLETLALSDGNPAVRHAAVHELIRGWQDVPQTLAWLKTCALLNDEGYVRRAAVEELARGWQDDPDTLPMLKSCALSDDDWRVRLSAVAKLVHDWPDDPDTLLILKTHALSDNNWRVRCAAVEELARGWKDNPDTLPILKQLATSDENESVQGAATREIAQVWKDDPDKFPWLKQLASSNEHYGLRAAAVQALVSGWKNDPDTLPLLKQWASSSNHEVVRAIAMQALVSGWKDDPDTLPILKQLATSDENEYVQAIAVRALVKGWKNDSNTLPLLILKTHALFDNHEHVRCAAMRELARGWKDEPGMFEFLCDRALNDPFEHKKGSEDNPRQLALEIIIKQYPDHPQTLPLLQDRAENDPDEKVREFAKKKLAEFV
jgi:predicted NACHT family NTPase